MEFQTFCKEGSDEEIYNYFKEYGKNTTWIWAYQKQN